MNRRVVIPALLWVLVAMSVAFIASPYWSASGIATAAYDGNVVALRRSVDFEALREDVKAQLMMKMNNVTANDDSAFSALGNALGALMVNKAVDTMISPAGISATLKAQLAKRGVLAKGRPSRIQIATRLATQRALHWDSLSQASLGDDQAKFVLERRGLNWVLVSIKVKLDDT